MYPLRVTLATILCASLLSHKHVVTAQCSTASFVPGHSRGGNGFDLTTLEAKTRSVFDMGDGTSCQRNSHTGKDEKVPDSIIDWSTLQECSQSVQHHMYNSAREYVNSQDKYIQVGLPIIGYALVICMYAPPPPHPWR